MKDKYELRLSGAGGQGLILAGLILAKAAVYDQKNVVQTQSYGPEARGGTSRSEVIISEKEIEYPKVTHPDLLLTLTQEAFDRYFPDLKKEGILITDSSRVKGIKGKPGIKVISLPLTRLAKKILGKEMVTNILALGVITEVTGIVSREAMKRAVLSCVPRGTEELNKKALEIGFKVGAQQKFYLNKERIAQRTFREFTHPAPL